MVSIKPEEHENRIQTDAVIIGNSIETIQSALTMAKMGVKVDMILDCSALSCNEMSGLKQNNRYIWPLLVQVTSHPMITIHTCSQVQQVSGENGNFRVNIIQQPRYIDDYLCTGCGRCQAECSVEVTRLSNGAKITQNAVHRPLCNEKSLPSTYKIDKNGISPCLVSCPLGINVHGFISLIAKGKVDKALELINESAPFAGILGRVCVHPCEGNCNRVNVDNPVSIQALHRYAADNAVIKTKYKSKQSLTTNEGKIAIVGSGPAGLTAAWKLTLLGYSPTVFEAHGVIGGMLATGIPRFRLPREVREREIEAIKNLGVDIRTGITVGRDVTFSYLKERGYKAFFLSIGAQKNNKLNIPGEDLDGVVDCMSLLLTLNLKVDTFVGENIVVIGDGNSAIDSARAAIRKSIGKVKILSWTVPEEITAAYDVIEEALQEKVSIDYLTAPIEILGDGGKVTGIRCQQTRLTDDLMPNGRHRPEPIPGTDFVIDADHVVVAIGQSPNTTQLNIEGLNIDSNSGSIQADPLTLETNIRGVFAGGDCISGPNNVVEAMAAGLRAAESIHRFIQGHDLWEGRDLEATEVAEFNIDAIEPSPYKRAIMPTIGSRKRTNSFEETTIGLSTNIAQTEAMRCLSCAICSNCMECERVCEVGAVSHDDTTRHFEIAAQTILISPTVENLLSNENVSKYSDIDGIRSLELNNEADFNTKIANAMAIAMETATYIKAKQIHTKHSPIPAEIHPEPMYFNAVSDKPSSEKRLGVVLCRCSGSISSIIDFSTLTRRLKASTNADSIMEIVQACTEAGANQIAQLAIDNRLDTIVLAACRCCGLDQVCYSCTDRRNMCLLSLYDNRFLRENTAIDFVNIREQCSWVHSDDLRGATRVATQMISASVLRARNTQKVDFQKTSAKRSVIVVGGGLSGMHAALSLQSLGIHTELVTRESPEQANLKVRDSLSSTGITINNSDLIVKPWPKYINLEGHPDNYVAVLDYGSRLEHVPIGAILLDAEDVTLDRGSSTGLFSSESLIGKIISRQKHSGASINPGLDLLRDLTVGKTAGIFTFPSVGLDSTQDHKVRGFAVAARISTYLEQQSITLRATAVSIDNRVCRGCGTCVAMCPYIETQARIDGTFYAYVDYDLCLGCGVCISVCPSGAITQFFQSDRQILETLDSLLRPNPVLSKVR